MEKRTDKYTRNSLLSQSYSETIEKIIGSDTKNESISIPGTVVHEREQYWNSLIQKYSDLPDGSIYNVDTLGQEETVDEQRLLMSKLPFRKSPSLIQYWIDTGNHPYKTHEEESEYSDSGSSLSERELSSLPHSAIGKHLNKNGTMRIQVCDSSSSSVDTTAYILSNTNITQKAKITTILEDAKYSSPQDVPKNSARKIDHAKNRRFGLDNKDISLDKNGNRSNYFCTLSTATGDSIILNKCNDIPDRTTLKKMVDTNDLRNERQTAQNDNVAVTDKAIAEILTGYGENIEKSVNNIKGYSQSTETIEQHNMEEQSNAWCTSSMKLNRRKKLYSGRDSPVDLARMESRYSDNLSQTRKSLHPALCHTATPKRRVPNQRKLVSKRRKGSHFAKEGCPNDRRLRVAVKKDYMENDVASQRENSYATSECEDTDMNINRKCSTGNNFVENQMLSPSDDKQHNNTILSSDMSAITNSTGESTSATKRPSIHLKKSHLDLNPVVRLTRLMPCEIEKYKTPVNFNPKLQLTKLAEVDIQKYKANKHKAALLPQIIQNEPVQFHSSISTISTPCTRIQAVDSDDTINSTQTTVLLSPCKDYKEAQQYSGSSSVCIDNNSEDETIDRDNSFRGTKMKSNDRDKKSFVTTLSDPLRRRRRKVYKNKAMKERGEITELRKTGFLTRKSFKSDSEYSTECAASSNKSEESRVLPKSTRDEDKNVNSQDNSSVDQKSKCLGNKMTISPRSSDAFCRSPESKISGESKLIGYHSSRTNVKTRDEKRVNRHSIVTSSDESEICVQRLRGKKRRKTASKNGYANGTIDEENSIRRRMSVMKQPQNIFVKLLQNKLVQSMIIRDQDRLDTQAELRENSKDNSAHKSIGNNSKNKTVRRHRKYYRIVSSSDESRLTDSPHSEIEKSFKSSNKKRSSRLRMTESTINHPDAVVETSKRHIPTRSDVSRNIFNRHVFDVSTDSSD